MDHDSRYPASADGEYGDVPEVSEPAPNTEECYELPDTSRSRSLIWSVVSMIASVLSVVLCPIFYLSLIFGATAILFAVISRKNLGYFDKMTLFGLTVGIFGLVFGSFSMIMDLTGMLDKLLGK